MNLILWRHAEAEDATPDINRRLTEKGRRQARLMADWLKSRLPEDLRILVSPAVRTRQTADALNMDYTIVDEIAPGADATELLAATDWPTAEGSVLVVGHQPTLGLAVSILLSGEETPLSIKKGAVFWITHRDRDESAQNVLKVVMSPEMLKGHD
jgi:phosphohistidine phosphatase